MSERREAYSLLAKQATGRALVTLIHQAIASPNLYSFYDLLQSENVQNLESTEHVQSLRLLELFSYGSFEDYGRDRSTLPPLGEPELDKLKRLSLVSMASESHHLPYAMLQQRLEIQTTRALEDLVISATYANLIKAKLNTRDQIVYIESTTGRDVQPSLDSIAASLDAWSRTCQSVLIDLQNAISETQQGLEKKRQDRENHITALNQVKGQLEAQDQNPFNLSKDRHEGEDELMGGMDEGNSLRQARGTTNPLGNRKRKTPTNGPRK